MAEDLKLQVNFDDKGSLPKAQQGMENLEKIANNVDKSVSKVGTSTGTMGNQISKANEFTGALRNSFIGLAGALAIPMGAAAAFSAIMKSIADEGERIREGFAQLDQESAANLRIQGAMAAGLLPASAMAQIAQVGAEARASGVDLTSGEYKGAAGLLAEASSARGIGMQRALTTARDVYATGGLTGSFEEAASAVQRAISTGQTRGLQRYGIYLDQDQLDGFEGDEKSQALFAMLEKSTAGATARLGGANDIGIQRMLSERRMKSAKDEYMQRAGAAMASEDIARTTYGAEMYNLGYDVEGSAIGGLGREAIRAITHPGYIGSAEFERKRQENRARLMFQTMTPGERANYVWGSAAPLVVDARGPANEE